MKWIGRIVALLVTLLATPSPLLIGMFVVPGLGGLLFLAAYVTAVSAGAIGIMLVGIPGLIVLDRQGPSGERRALGSRLDRDRI